MDAKALIAEYNFSAAERQLIEQANTPTTADMNQSRVLSELVLGKNIQKAADAIIQSNKELALSNDEYSARMVGLTRALVFVGAVQILVQLIQFAIPLINRL